MKEALIVTGTGLVTSVGNSTAATLAAIRAGISNPKLSRFIDGCGAPVFGHSVQLNPGLFGPPRLARMCALAVEEALSDVPRADWQEVIAIICMAEASRPGRMHALDEHLPHLVQQELGFEFTEQPRLLPQGRVSMGTALRWALGYLQNRPDRRVLVAATDSLLHAPTINALDARDRLLTDSNSNGFLPGEGAGAVLVHWAERSESGMPAVVGVGVGVETATIDHDLPLRGDGMVTAVAEALGQAGLEMSDVDYRVSDASGEEYYFKEAALVPARLLRRPKERLDVLLPASSVGETGAVAGPVALCAALREASRLAGRPRWGLVHMSNDDGARAAMVVCAGGAA